MKRVSVLALLLVSFPLAWAEEAAAPADATAVTEAVPAVAPSAEPTSSEEAVSVEAASPETVEASPLAAELPPAPQPPASVVAVPSIATGSHRVVKGDTLWDLAGSYLKDPFLWPKILQANQDRIQNPNLIFPDQEFVIPSVEAAATLTTPVAAVEAPAETAPEKAAAESESSTEEVAPAESESSTEEVAPAQAEDMDIGAVPEKKIIDVAEEASAEPEEGTTAEEREAKKKRSLAVPGAGFMGGSADSFIADENWEYDGYVLRDRDQRFMISQGDVVFLNIGAASGVKPKMVAHVYRVGKKVKDPYLKKKTGRLVKRVGSVMVTGQITDEGCTAVVTNSLEAIRIGDIVKFVAK